MAVTKGGEEQMNTTLVGILVAVAVTTFTVAYAVTAWAAGSQCCGMCVM